MCKMIFVPYDDVQMSDFTVMNKKLQVLEKFCKINRPPYI